jgi:hypothetical protein
VNVSVAHQIDERLFSPQYKLYSSFDAMISTHPGQPHQQQISIDEDGSLQPCNANVFYLSTTGPKREADHHRQPWK